MLTEFIALKPLEIKSNWFEKSILLQKYKIEKFCQQKLVHMVKKLTHNRKFVSLNLVDVWTLLVDNL